MKYTLLLTTQYFMDEFAQKELSSFNINLIFSSIKFNIFARTC